MKTLFAEHWRRWCILLVALVLVFTQASALSAAEADDVRASRVSSQAAYRAALAWLNLHPDFALVDGSRYVPADKLLEIRSQDEVVAYVLTLQPQGFIIVTPNVNLNPILAYSSQAVFDAADVPQNTLLALVRQDVPQRLQAVATGAVSAEDRAAALDLWVDYLALVDAQGMVHADQIPLQPEADVEHGPFLTSRWSQSTVGGDAVWNYYTPPGPDGSSSNYVSGCVSTALAQILNYYEWPITGVGSHSYTWNNGTDPAQTLSADFAATTYPWSDMRDYYTTTTTLAERQAAGLVTYHAGVAVDMNYSQSGSGAPVADIPQALESYFRSSGDYIRNPADADFYTRLYDTIVAHRPAVLGMTEAGGANGHAVVVDGVRHDIGDDDGKTRYYHLNMGWAGSSDAWYDLPDVPAGSYTFAIVDEAVVDIIPIAYLNDPGSSTAQSTFPVSWTVSINQGTCTYDLQQVYAAPGSIADGAESGIGNWSVENGNWATSDAQAHNGTYAFRGWFSVPESSSPRTLRFNKLLKVSATTDISYWWRTDYWVADGGTSQARLEISTDGGEWNTLTTHTAWNSGVWAEQTVSSAELATYVGQFVYLRFALHVGGGFYDGNTYPQYGFFVDDFAINNAYSGDWTVVANDVAGTTTNVTVSQAGDYAYRVQDSCSQQWSNVQTIAYTGASANQAPNTPSAPSPADSATDVATDATLSWTGGDPDAGDTVTYTVAFGDVNPPPVVSSTVTAESYDPGTLTASVSYYWIITATDGVSTTAGPLWSFTTAAGTPANQAPNIPSAPSPADSATDVATDATLSWTGGDPDAGDTVTYTVAFGDVNPPPVVSSTVTAESYDPGTLAASASYYWVITATDGVSTTAGPLWSFTTAAGTPANQAPNMPSAPSPADSATDVATDATLSWTGGDPDAGDMVTYTVAFGTSSTPPVVGNNVAAPSYNPGALTASTRYYWKITATDGVSTTVGSTWSFTTTAGSSDGLVNGDFSQGQTGWTNPDFLYGDPNNPVVPGSCSPGQAQVGGDFGGGGVGQCIPVTHATEWTLSVLMRVLDGPVGTQAIAMSEYYTTTDCSGVNAHMQTLTTTLQTERVYSSTYTYDTQANNIQSILVSLKATGGSGLTNDPTHGCFDDVALTNPIAADKYIYLPLVLRSNAGK